MPFLCCQYSMCLHATGGNYFACFKDFFILLKVKDGLYRKIVFCIYDAWFKDF